MYAITPEAAQRELRRSTIELERSIIAAQRRDAALKAVARGSVRDVFTFNREVLQKILLENLEKDRKTLEILICQKLHYCAVSKSAPAAFILSFIDACIDSHVTVLASYPVPAVTAAAYILKTGLLDSFCKCADSKVSQQQG